MSNFAAPVNVSPEEIEQDRIERLAAEAEDRESTPEELIADFAPGTFGCHEALHTASIVMNLVDERLCEHPAILANPDWYRLASEAHMALYNLYQAIGARHIGDEVQEA
ncbi:hypothetical protein [Ancylobacter pratisalsi]|uniref:Uncharacterized protein n=1 Tax=Ancylobacter pratisalsi TaxID=1745854 RepID=A0A6P1YHA8_9HYPH|nr:hypothetical protein [Ancylobacter pratisalsi]QIB32677.1 hypothetical protein G3A50_02395 [Ancylobacter pratisalsi]